MEDKRKCIKCKELKTRKFVGKFDEKNKKFLDDEDKLWSGNTCPNCHKKEMKNRMKALRALKKVLKRKKIFK